MRALPDRWMLAGTDSMWLGGRLLRPGLEYALRGSPPRVHWHVLRSDSSLARLKVRVLPFSLADQYQHPMVRSPRPIDAAPDTAVPVAVPGLRGAPAAIPSDVLGRLQIAGSKTVALEFGSRRDAAVRQSLDLSVGGDLGPDLNLVAVLSDRNLPLSTEGGTQDLTSLDRVSVELKSTRYAASLGDFDLRASAGPYLALDRALQGAKGHAEGGITQFDGAAGIAKGRFFSRQLAGEEGRQGPYPLPDAAGRTPATLVAGSEVVYLDGERLRRGDAADYVMDYGRGEVTFTARHPLHTASRIAVDYEVAADQFRRSFSYFRAGVGRVDSTGLSLALFREADDPSQPLGGALSAADLDSLRASGTQGELRTSGIRMVGAGKGDYRLLGAGSSQEHFQFAGRDSGDYLVEFLRVTDGTGSYQDSVFAGGIAFAWRGPGGGQFLPGRRLQVPASDRILALSGGVALGPVQARVDAAGSFRTTNVLSGASAPVRGALRVGLSAGSGEGSGMAGLWSAHLRGERQEAGFLGAGRVLPPFEEQDWNLGVAAREAGRTTWTADASLRPGHGMLLGLGAGLWDLSGAGGAVRWSVQGALERKWAVGARVSAVRNHDAGGAQSASRLTSNVTLLAREGGVRPEGWWRRDLGAGPGGRDSTGSEELGTALHWKGSTRWSADASQAWRRDLPRGGAGAQILSSTQQLGAQWSSPFGMHLQGSVSQRLPRGGEDSTGQTRNALVQAGLSRSGWDADLRYDLAASRFLGRARQVIFVGAGLGAYDSLGNYTGRGDYTVRSYDTGTSAAALRVGLNGRVEWSGERAGREDGLRHWSLRTELQSSEALRRNQSGQPLLPWPGRVAVDTSVLTGTVVFRQDLEWSGGEGRTSVRARHDWQGSADRASGSYLQARHTRVEALRLRAEPTGGWTVELEGRVRRRTASQGPLEQARDYVTHASEWLGSLGWVPSARWSGTFSAQRLSEQQQDGEAHSRQWQWSPAVRFASASRVVVEEKVQRISLEELGGSVPGFENYGALLRSRWEQDLQVHVRLSSVVQGSVLGHSLHPDGSVWTHTARMELRALF